MARVASFAHDPSEGANDATINDANDATICPPKVM